MSHNYTSFVKNYKHYEKLELDLDSPTMKQAMSNLGIGKEEISKK